MRKVTLTISTYCSTKEGHQPGFLQFSVDETWIPPFPLKFPMDGGSGGDDEITQELEQVVDEVHYWLRAAQNSRNTGVGWVDDVTFPSGEFMEKGAKASRSITFWARNEIDLSTSKDKASPTTSPQIAMHAQVEPADVPEDKQNVFTVKVHGRNDLLEAGNSVGFWRPPLGPWLGPFAPLPFGGWPGAPGEVDHQPIRLNPREGLQISTRESDAWLFFRDKSGAKKKKGKKGISLSWTKGRKEGIRIKRRLPDWRKPHPFWWVPWWRFRNAQTVRNVSAASSRNVLEIVGDGIVYEVNDSIGYGTDELVSHLVQSLFSAEVDPLWAKDAGERGVLSRESRHGLPFVAGDWLGAEEERTRPLSFPLLAAQVPQFLDTGDSLKPTDLVEMYGPTGRSQSPLDEPPFGGTTPRHHLNRTEVAPVPGAMEQFDPEAGFGGAPIGRGPGPRTLDTREPRKEE